MDLYPSANDKRKELIMKHNTETQFGFATVILVFNDAGNLVVWWAKVDRIDIRVLSGKLAANAENELISCVKDR